MMRFAFVSRHAATEEQKTMARKQSIELIEVGDRDVFAIQPSFLHDHPKGPFGGVVVVHPAAALRLCSAYFIGVFENEKRSPIGGPVTFHPKRLVVYDLTD